MARPQRRHRHSKKKPRSSGRIRLHPAFASRLLGNERTLAVYVPPGYDTDTERRYPVLYMHDGQNLFDTATAAFGVAWEAGRTATRLIRSGRIEPILIVGIYNTPDRIQEYTTCVDPATHSGGRGELYARFVLREVKPFIDTHYRTKPSREHTAVAGSSLGGLVSLTMVQHHHDQISMCAAISPSLWWAGARLLDELAAEHAWMPSVRFWLDMGTNEGANHAIYGAGIARTRRLSKLFRSAGLVARRDYRYVEARGGEHNEANWGGRFKRVLKFFFASKRGRESFPGGK